MTNSNKVTVGHPFYFPTQVALVDDDQDFLHGISLMLDNSLSHKLFASAVDALDYMNTAHQHANILQRCYSSYQTGPLASDSLVHVDIAKIQQEVLNPDRFNTVSTLVIDYSMPEMNGLEFLAALKNPFVKKVLLTGKGDMEMAVRAFNSQLIDQYIDKHDPGLKVRLNEAISAFQDQYFRHSFKLVTDQILTNNQDGFLVSPEFQQYFSDQRSRLGIVEYYLLDEPCNGFLLVDGTGRCHLMLIHTDQSLADHKTQVKSLNAPEELVTRLDHHAVVPAYDDNQEKMAKAAINLQHWQQFYVEADTVRSATDYHVAVFAVEDTGFIPSDRILSFHAFQQQSAQALNHIIH